MILDSIFTKRASLENPSTSLSDPANWLYHAFGAQPTAADIVVTDKNVTQYHRILVGGRHHFRHTGRVADQTRAKPNATVPPKRSNRIERWNCCR